MNGKALLDYLNSSAAADQLVSLYGSDEPDAARRRYASLVEGLILDEPSGFPKNEFPETAGELRVFTAAGRTELGGNHTDHNRGKVLAASIQLDSAAIVAPRKDKKVFFRSTGYPDVSVDISDLSPQTAEKGTTEALVRGIAAEFAARGFAPGGFTANADSTVLPGSGLSSSAAVEVLFGRIFDKLYGGGRLSALEIAQIGQKAENNYFGKPCGLMDQTACASGGAVAIDFADLAAPQVKQINFDPASAGFVLCVVNTWGNHADLTPDYAAIPEEMYAAAKFFGKTVLRETNLETVLSRAAELRKALGDRALLRSIHFFNENDRVTAMQQALEQLDAGANTEAKQRAVNAYLALVNESGDSSWELLQNIYSPKDPANQGLTTALALSKEFIRTQGGSGACRVHGGGFAGTIQAYIPTELFESYRNIMDTIFGEKSVTPIRIRPVGAEELQF
ncbi:galactokinase [Spirochaetia bacterium]|nr:galactokinase [Spirochaetia bacterium]